MALVKAAQRFPKVQTGKEQHELLPVAAAAVAVGVDRAPHKRTNGRADKQTAGGTKRDKSGKMGVERDKQQENEASVARPFQVKQI